MNVIFFLKPPQFPVNSQGNVSLTEEYFIMTFIRIALAAAFLFSATIHAQAATVDLGWATYTVEAASAAPTSGNIDMQSVSLSNTTASRISRTLTGSPGEGVTLVKLSNAGIVKGNDSKHIFTNVRPTGVTKDEKYLAVWGCDSLGWAGTATFELAKGMTSFSFLWGSIDDYNKIIVTAGEGTKSNPYHTYTIEGKDLIQNAALGITEGVTTKYFTLTDLATIKSIVFKSCCDAFEIARLSVVPLPAAALLFGTAIAGAAAVRRRKKNNA